MATTSERKSTNLTLDRKLIAEAKALGINVSRAAERGLSAEIKAERERLWKLENAKAIQCANDYVERNGLPLEHLRTF
ncbi:type II toxin-antitoxin system CcdA family antitoxin [Rhizobium sp. L1K21]|uniref:type II toxin-antitoxin system CcdA family antitoxin n=1 Tax=Rhizobium sp. L1K21 TaxID=2954933 RepID=UPI0020937BD8|nr:type II toxin-antitoxin system CcdA family antitoxin [Rhizobium sp. L1K21]MCO6187408.1 type II toxin-antitoxin system CcdA family antitoxin [Rhizobium sp. L1K21]